MAVEKSKVESATMDVEQKKTKLEKKNEKKPTNLSHPPYFQMIKEALLALNERGGSSPYAIAKYMEEKHKEFLPANYKKMLAVQLKNCASKEKLIKIKASYKLSQSSKREKIVSKPSAEEKKKKKPSKPKSAVAASAAAPATKSTKSVKKASRSTVKKVAVVPKKMKKTTPAKPKQPKSIKSPVKPKQLKSIKSPAKKSRKTAA